MRRTVRRLAAGVALLAAVGCATSTAGSGSPAGGLAGGPTPTGSGTGAPTGAPTTAPPSSPTAAPSSAGPTAAGETVSFGPMRMVLTRGTTARADGGLLCVTVPGDSGCTLEVLDVGAIRSAGGSVSTPDPGAPNGWWWGSDVPSCGGIDYVEVTKSTVVESGFKPVGSRTAEYGSWVVTCRDGNLNFNPRLWWLPTSQLAFRAHSTVAGRGEAVDRLLAGVTVS